MKVNVLIFTGYGMHCMPKNIQQILLDETLSFPYNRLINEKKLKEIRKKADVLLDYSCDISLYEQCKNSKYGLIKLAENTFYFNDFNTQRLCPFMIKEVDTSRPWKIEEYDGAEYIQYLDYEVKYKDINYCDYK